MTTHETHLLHDLLDSVEDTRDIVVRRYDADDLAHAVWQAARDDAQEAYAAWRRERTRDAWAVLVAAQDREDAALAAFGAAPVRG